MGMKNAYPAVAPPVISEKVDDREATLDFRPNGDDVHHFNMGHGCRWRNINRRADWDMRDVEL
jgi:hypothetical protein